MITLVLLHGQMSIFSARNVLSCNGVIMTAQLIESFLVEIVSLWVKEVTTRQNVETIIVILSWSILNLLSCVLLDSWCGLLLWFHLVDNLTLLSHHLEVHLLIHLRQLRLRRLLLLCLISRTVVLELVNFLWRWRLCLVFELTICKTVLLLRMERLLVYLK